MESLFGVPTAQIARALALATLVTLLGITALGLRSRVLVRLGARNLPRRPLRSLIIVVGLALSTVVIATAFATGDAMTLTLRSLITGSLGQVDEVITTNRSDFTQVNRQDVNALIAGSLPANGAGFFPISRFTGLQNALRGNTAIAGLMPAILEQGSAADGEAKLAHANISMLAIPPGQTPGFAVFTDSSKGNRGARLRIDDLAPTEVYVNQAAANLLGTGAERLLRVYLPPPGSAQNAAPVEDDFTVRAVVANGALGGLQPTVFLSLAQMQRRRQHPNAINEILIVNRGGSASVTRSAAATLALRKLIVDPNAAEEIRAAIASDAGRSVLSLAAGRLSGEPRTELLDLQRTAEKGRVTGHLLYLLGDPRVAAVLRASAASLPTRNGRAFRTLRRLNPLTVVEVKQGALDQADQYGSILTSIFIVLGLFSIVAGILLVFLIFVMLAAERQVEMGMARAIGMRRWHLIQTFVFEGILYDLASTALGVGIGIGISHVIVAFVGRTLAGFGIPVAGGVQLRSVVIAFCLGALVTFATVAVSAWRVSRFNIVAAIHGLPDPPKVTGHRGQGTGRASPRLGWGGAALFPLTCNLSPIFGGYALMFVGQLKQEYVLFALGVSLLIAGGALILRRLLIFLHAAAAAADRLSASLAGVGLIVFWALPPSFFDRHGQRLLIGGMETFSLAGIMMVFGAVLIVAYNLSGPLQILERLLGRSRSLVPAIKMAIAFPLQHRFRTGMTVAMFSLVVFTMIVSALLLSSARVAYTKQQQPPAGYEIIASAPTTANLIDITGALAGAKTVKPADFAGVGSDASFLGEGIEPLAVHAAWQPLTVHLADVGLLQATPLRLSGRARGYATDGAVWQALRDQRGTAVVSRDSLPLEPDTTLGAISGPLAADTSFAPVTIWVRDSAGAEPARLTIIGVVDDHSALPSGLLTFWSNVLTPTALGAVPQDFFFKVQPGESPDQAALGLQLAFGSHGLQPRVVGDNLRAAQNVSGLLNFVLEGFVGLGLVAGMAALAVISTRAVVERRQQIGMLRAIGMQRRLIQLSFLFEASFTAWIGIGAGILLGFLLANNVVSFLSQTVPDLSLDVPWSEIAGIAALAYVASLASTLVAAWQAGRIDPAEALRYE